MNISTPDINSDIYKEFIRAVKTKVNQAENWLIEHNIDYVWNYWIGNHLYRLYIPNKDLLLDFEYYPINNVEYNYIRVNFDDDIIQLLNKLFPKNVLDTANLQVCKLSQRSANRFLREQHNSPIYNKNVLRLAFVKDNIIYQCMAIKDNKIIANVTRQDYSISYGTYILLRYLNEMFGFSEILIKESLDNSYKHTIFQILNVPIVEQSIKKKIWWNPTGAKWHIKREDTDKYIPFYYCESRVYKYN